MTRNLARFLGAVLAAALAVAAAALAPSAANAAGPYSLLVFPDQGQSAVYSFLNTATTSIDMTMYELRDTTVVNALISRERAGVRVRVILDAANTSVNGSAYSALQAGGVGVTYSSSSFVYTHQKTITVDGAKSLVMTGNLDSTYYATSRDYAVFDPDVADVAAIERVFNADYAKTSITPTDGDNLVWSPTDSQSRLLSLITGAQHTLDVEELEFGDTALVNAIVADAKRGVRVRVVVEDPSSYTTQINQVKAAGGTVTSYSSSTGFYVHAKVIVADYGTSTAKVFAGSENFSDNSLNHNRELGLIINDAGVLGGVESAFSSDFGVTTVTVLNPGNQTGTVGTAASLQIHATDSTAGRTLTYHATGLPAGLAINAGTGLISGTPSAAATSTVTVTVTDSASASGSTTFSWTINPTSGGGGCAAAQLLGNPGFETGTAAPWTASTGVLNNQTTQPPHSGTWDARLDGHGATHTDTLSQTVTLPTGCASYQLSFWLHIDTAETSTSTAYDTLSAQVVDGSGTVLATLATYSNLNHITGYAQRGFTLSSYAGQTVTLRLTGTEDYTKQTSFVVDDTALTVS